MIKNKKTKWMAYRRMSICKSCKVYNDGVCDSTKYHIAIKDFRYNGELRFQGRVYIRHGLKENI